MIIWRHAFVKFSKMHVKAWLMMKIKILSWRTFRMNIWKITAM
nr:MAG TPA: hypothetical protein [Caudoviricetes sp.]